MSLDLGREAVYALMGAVMSGALTWLGRGMFIKKKLRGELMELADRIHKLEDGRALAVVRSDGVGRWVPAL